MNETATVERAEVSTRDDLKTLGEILSDPKLRDRYTDYLNPWRHQLHKEERRPKYGELVREVGVRYADCDFENYRVYEESAEGRLSQRQVLQQVTEFALNMGTLLRSGGGLVLYGRPGTGKDHLLLASAYLAIFKHGWDVTWIDGSNLYMKARQRISDESSELSFVRRFTDPLILIVSDPVPPKGDASVYNVDLLQRIIDRRYRDMKSTWASINVHDGTEAEARLASPIVDRLRDKSLTLECKWESWRARKNP